MQQSRKDSHDYIFSIDVSKAKCLGLKKYLYKMQHLKLFFFIFICQFTKLETMNPRKIH